MSYYRQLKSGIVITNIRAEHAEQLEELQVLCYPTLAPAERFRAEHYRQHIEMFPAGQFAALDGDKVVGMTSTIRQHFDFDHLDHTFAELLQGGWMTAHHPDGEWLYGMDMGTHPDYRQRGISRGLYYARQDTVRRLGLRGQLAGGMMIGYGKYKGQLSAEAYFAKLQAGELFDPTVSAQMRVGFRAHALLPGYITDPTCDNYGVLIVLDADQDVVSE